MAASNCKNCQSDFIYDAALGLNIAYFEGGSNATCFWAGGDFPCCPGCEQKCAFEQTTFSMFDIKIETRFVKNKKNYGSNKWLL